jgi:4-hydroxy-3-methylbut-2-enyl diphosphate reductase
MVRRYGENEIEERFAAQKTICSATQDRQDAVRELIELQPDLIIVSGGYNSSNTGHLAEIASQACPTYHVDRPDCLVSPDEIRHRPAGAKEEVLSHDWLPAGRVTVGVTAGASTPNTEVGGVLERILRFRGVDPDSLLAGES